MRILLVVLILSSVAFSEEEKKKRELPKSGVLAATFLDRAEGQEVPSVWGEDDSGEKPPLGASLSRKDLGKWEASLVNQSETDTYYALISVEFKSKTGSSLGSHRFAFTLKPGERVARAVSGPQSVDQGFVNLESWKNISEKAKKKESAPEETEAVEEAK